jgi:ParB family transcriptional regulator, chromosome partitioning protein
MPSARRNGPVISFEAVQQTRQTIRPVQDRIVYELEVTRITPSPRNPREDLGDIDELAESIEAFDLLQPVVVRRLPGDRYELIAGHRRFAAVQQLGRQKIAAVVRDADDDQAYLLTLAENLAREDLTPAEEAAGLGVLVREHGWSVRQVAEAIHKSPAFVSLRLRVFEAEDLRAPVLEEQLSVSAAEELLRVPAELRPALVEKAIRERWTPTQARRARLAARAKCLDSKHPSPEPHTPRLDRLGVGSAELLAAALHSEIVEAWRLMHQWRRHVAEHQAAGAAAYIWQAESQAHDLERRLRALLRVRRRARQLARPAR